MKQNCERAILIGNRIRKAIPAAEIYIPAEHEDFVQRAYDKKYLNEKQILEIDCDIVNTCDGVIVLLEDEENHPQGGRLVEYEYAYNHNIPIVAFYEIGIPNIICWITHQILRA